MKRAKKTSGPCHIASLTNPRYFPQLSVASEWLACYSSGSQSPPPASLTQAAPPEVAEARRRGDARCHSARMPEHRYETSQDKHLDGARPDRDGRNEQGLSVCDLQKPECFMPINTIV